MTFPQSKLEDWAKAQGRSHADFMTEAIASAYNEGYETAYPHAAKHTVEKVLEIAADVLTPLDHSRLCDVLTDKESWK